MKLGGYRYTIETKAFDKWRAGFSTDDEALAQQQFDNKLKGMTQPTRLLDRATGTVLRYHIGRFDRP